MSKDNVLVCNLSKAIHLTVLWILIVMPWPSLAESSGCEASDQYYNAMLSLQNEFERSILLYKEVHPKIQSLKQHRDELVELILSQPQVCQRELVRKILVGPTHRRCQAQISLHRTLLYQLNQVQEELKVLEELDQTPNPRLALLKKNEEDLLGVLGIQTFSECEKGDR